MKCMTTLKGQPREQSRIRAPKRLPSRKKLIYVQHSPQQRIDHSIVCLQRNGREGTRKAGARKREQNEIIHPIIPIIYLSLWGCLEVLVEGQHLLGGVHAHAGLGVFSDALLEEVGLALERDHLHPVEGIDGVVALGAAQAGQ